MTGALYSLYFLFKTTESTIVCLRSEQQSKVCGQAMTIQLEPMCSENLSRDPVSPAWISGLLYRNWKNTFKKKKIITAKREKPLH